MSIDANLNRIRAWRHHKGFAIYRLATMAGVNEAAIRKIDSPEWNPTANTIRKFEAVIPADFMMAANDTGAPSATKADRGDDQTKAA
jgi:ribosome-binding protein aMBF1 (putative translation factor)